MWNRTPLTERLGLAYPIIQAPMAGGPTTPEMVAAVAKAGGLGTLAGGYQTPDQIRAGIHRVRTLTDRPFAVNLLLPQPVTSSAAALERAQTLMRPFRETLGLGAPPEPGPEPSIDDQIAVLLEEGVAAFSFTFALPTPAQLEAFRRARIVLIGTATTVEEALALEAAGVDMVVAQGSEAGGHRGTFLGPYASSLVGTMALVPAMVDRVRLPVIAAGGLMDGRGILAALALGAAGAQLGTAFLATPESGANPHYRRMLSESTETSTHVTRAYTGKAVRAIANTFTRTLGPHEAELPEYPIQHALTRDLRRKAADVGNTDLMGMWAGQGTRLLQSAPSAELMAGWVRQIEATLERLKG